MLWYKSWVETRSRFLIGMGLLMCSAAAVVFVYPRVVALLPLVPALNMGGEIGRRVREAAELQRTYPGYVWANWFQKNMLQLWTVFAVLLGAGGLLSQTSGGAALYTLSLPVSRMRLMGIRAATGLAELLALAVVPSLMIPLLSPAVGETYGLGNALIHSAFIFTAGAAFFSLAFLLSTVYADLWRPLLIALSAAAVLGLCDQLFRDFSRYSIFAVMSGETWFRNRDLPWLGLLTSVVISALMLYGAAVNIERRDF